MIRFYGGRNGCNYAARRMHFNPQPARFCRITFVGLPQA